MDLNYICIMGNRWAKYSEKKYADINCYVKKIGSFDNILEKQILRALKNQYHTIHINNVKNGLAIVIKSIDSTSYIYAYIHTDRSLYILEECYEKNKQEEHLNNYLDWFCDKIKEEIF